MIQLLKTIVIIAKNAESNKARTAISADKVE